MSSNEDRIEKTLGIMTGDYTGDIPAPESRIEVLLQKIINDGGGSGGGGVKYVILTESQYDIHGIPIISDPDEGTIYLVPTSSYTGNLYDEFIFVNSKWEKIGSSIPGPKGDSYELTTADKNEIAQIVMSMLPSAVGVNF